MSPTTFREIETAKGILATNAKEQSPLSDWYFRMRDVPLAAFGVKDLCKSVRQDLYPEYVVPVALEVLEKEPLAGDMYDGELAMAFGSITDSFWREHPVLADRVIRILRNTVNLMGEDIASDGQATIAKLEGLLP